MYQTATVGGKLIIYRIADKAYIPVDDGSSSPVGAKNKDYAEYLAWVAAGNTPGAYTGG